MIDIISVLVLEDELAIAEAVQYRFELEGYFVQHVMTCQEALTEIKKKEYHFAIFDVGLPDGSGFELCKKVREFSQIPILFLTARSDEIDRVVGLEIGADDYMTKPFSPRELLARVKATLRRMELHTPQEQKPVASASSIEVNFERCQISYQGQPLTLTKAEYKLLATLCQNAGRVFSREQLLEEISDDPGAALDRVIDAHIKSIRSKLKSVSLEGAELIETRRGLGYTFRG